MIIWVFGLVLLLLGTTNGESKVFFNKTEREIHMDQTVSLPFTIEGFSSYGTKANLTAISSDVNIVEVKAAVFDPSLIHDGTYRSYVNATGVFLGNAEVALLVQIDEVRFFFVSHLLYHSYCYLEIS